MRSFPALPSRILGAALGIAAVLALSLPDWHRAVPLLVAASAVSALAAVEASRLFAGRAPLAYEAALAAAAGVAAWSVAAGSPLAPAALVLPGFVAGARTVFGGNPSGSLRSVAATGWISAAVAASLGLLVRMRIESFWVFMIPLLVCWLGDTCAFLAGCAFGRHRMAPSTSPSKTWEGFAAGLAGSVAGAVLAGSLGAGLAIPKMALLGLVSGGAGSFADLVESALKRDSGAKDSGRFLPGHGGVLDRIDSLLAAIPAAWLLLYLWGMP